MSLEDALKANTEAVKANTAVLERMMASAKPMASGAAAGTKPAAAAATKPAATKPAATKKAPTLESVTEAVTSFLKTGDKETRDARKGQVGLIVSHYGTERFTQIPEESWPEALGYLKDFAEGRTPAFIDEGGGDEGDDGDGDDEGLV